MKKNNCWFKSYVSLVLHNNTATSEISLTDETYTIKTWWPVRHKTEISCMRKKINGFSQNACGIIWKYEGFSRNYYFTTTSIFYWLLFRSHSFSQQKNPRLFFGIPSALLFFFHIIYHHQHNCSILFFFNILIAIIIYTYYTHTHK